MKLYPKYYHGLLRSYDAAFKDFSATIDLDVRRTKAAVESPAVYKRLTNILFAHAKYLFIMQGEILESDTAKDSTVWFLISLPRTCKKR